jgi:hypothetical protein
MNKIAQQKGDLDTHFIKSTYLPPFLEFPSVSKTDRKPISVILETLVHFPQKKNCNEFLKENLKKRKHKSS